MFEGRWERSLLKKRLASCVINSEETPEYVWWSLYSAQDSVQWIRSVCRRLQIIKTALALWQLLWCDQRFCRLLVVYSYHEVFEKKI